MRMRFKSTVWALVGMLLAAVCAGGAAEGFRNIVSFTADWYFTADWRLETNEVFLARLTPALTAVAKISRTDLPGRSQHRFALGPVVSFTDTLYLEAVYGLGVSSEPSAGRFSHELDLNFNWETDAASAAAGLKADWFPAVGYSYYIPSLSAKFHLLPALAFFGKFFLSIDSNAVDTESFWGQAEYRVSSLLGLRAGFTASRSEAFGYSLIAGIDLFFPRALVLKYTVQYLSDTIEYGSGELRPRSGISNALFLDLRF